MDQYNTFLTALPLIEEALKRKGGDVEVARPKYDGEAFTAGDLRRNEEDSENVDDEGSED